MCCAPNGLYRYARCAPHSRYRYMRGAPHCLFCYACCAPNGMYLYACCRTQGQERHVTQLFLYRYVYDTELLCGRHVLVQSCSPRRVRNTMRGGIRTMRQVIRTASRRTSPWTCRLMEVAPPWARQGTTRCLQAVLRERLWPRSVSLHRVVYLSHKGLAPPWVLVLRMLFQQWIFIFINVATMKTNCRRKTA